MNSSEIRESFLNYFEKHGHTRVGSSSLVPQNDPTLFFTNAGMVQFKDVFLGSEKRGYKRAASSQKCMRVSGKHNDLENVGRTSRHHTFFEMLGNFSFGDYFKKEAIAFAWEFLTKTVGMPEKELYITVFRDDDEAEKLWLKHVDKKKIFRLGEKDNFWSMGETGPCGPCSEIHIDRAPSGAVKAEDFETDRFMEIWNLVFMQFDKSSDGKLTKLAKPSIDTGMGLERLSAVIEGVKGNYETDLFLPLIGQLEKITGKKYSADYSAGAKSDISMRVIADHIRSMIFLIADGVQPSNEGRGYVLRRIARRALRHGKLLGVKEPFFVPLAHTVMDMMGSTFAEVILHGEFIEKVIANEESRFNETLDKGLEILDRTFTGLKKKGENILSGIEVFKLYDTFGFPKDLTEDIAAEAGFKIDNAGFEKEMNSQRERARGAWKGSGETAVESVYKDLAKKGVKSEFVGYENLSCYGKVLAIIDGGKDRVEFVTGKTPFYGASGGQIGDTGMAVAEGIEVAITDTKKPFADMTVHVGKVVKGKLSEGIQLTLAVDADRRKAIERNHTATHILHRALRETLGEHVKQAGSLVGPDKLRFDFSHFSQVGKNELKEIETAANRIVRENRAVSKEVLPYKEAVTKGALAFFGDKYGETVRMVCVTGYSTELCGGAHVERSGDIGLIKILSESSVAAGVRRIEAITGEGAEEYVNKIENEQAAIASILKASGYDVISRIEKLITENRKLQKDMEKVRAQMVARGDGASEDAVLEAAGVRIIAKFVDGADPKELRGFSDGLKTKVASGVVMLVTEQEEKTSLLIAVTDDLTARFKAGALMKDITAAIGGTGGGRPDMAQGGAPVTGKFEELKQKLIEIVSK